MVVNNVIETANQQYKQKKTSRGQQKVFNNKHIAKLPIFHHDLTPILKNVSKFFCWKIHEWVLKWISSSYLPS